MNICANTSALNQHESETAYKFDPPSRREVYERAVDLASAAWNSDDFRDMDDHMWFGFWGKAEQELINERAER